MSMDQIMATGGEGWGLSEEEWMLKCAVRELVEAEISPRFRECDTEENAEKFYRESMKKLGEAGFLRAWVPEEFGGYGQRLTAALIVTEEVSRGNGALGMHVFLNPFLGTTIARINPVAWAGIGEKVLDGEMLLSGAGCAPEGQANFAEQADIARIEGDFWVLNGEKSFSSGGTIADLILVRGLCDGTQYAWPLKPGTPGLTIVSNPELGASPAYATLQLRDVRIPKTIGGATGACFDRQHPPAPPAGRAFDMGVVAMAIGAAGAAYDETVEYLTNRTSFFKPIASLGIVQYKLVEMKMKLEAARSLMYTAARMVECNHRDACAFVDMAKTYCCDVARHITDDCIPMWGCVGYNPESGISRHHLDAIGYGIGLGTSEQHINSAAYHLGLPKSDNPLVF